LSTVKFIREYISENSVRLERITFQRDVIFKEWDSLLNKMQKHDDQIKSIKDWCIATIGIFIGIIITQYPNLNSSSPNSGILLSIPIAIIFFFLLNEGIVQMWKWEAIERLYDIDKIIREIHENDLRNNILENQFGKELIEFKPSLISSNTRIKIDYEIMKNWNRRCLINTITAFNFSLFYGLLILLYSSVILGSSIAGNILTILLLFLLFISIAWIFACIIFFHLVTRSANEK
jgi:hypothetical protein